MIGRSILVLTCVFLLSNMAVAVDPSPGSAREDQEKTDKKKDSEKKKKKKKKSAVPEDVDPTMAAWMKAGAVGKEHRALRALVGSWDVKSTFWMVPGAPPMVSEGTSRVRLILGGRFTREDYRGSFMGIDFEGIGITGYDNIKKNYTGLWLENMSTSVAVSEGTANASGKGFTFTGTYYDPAREKTIRTKMVIRIEDRDHRVSEAYEVDDDGKETKNMELVYTRAAKKQKSKKDQ